MRITYVAAIVFIAIASSLHAFSQNVGIWTPTPRAPFNVAENKTVLFGSDTSGAGQKFIWYPTKGAVRFGILEPFFSSTAWDYANVGVNSLAFGSSTLASGPQSIASGAGSQSTGYYTWAHGFAATASGDHSLAFGQALTANGVGAYAFGDQLLANNNWTFATGYGNFATGSNSAVFGYGNLAKAHGCFVLGRYNDSIGTSSNSAWVAADPVFIIGNGTSYSAPSNAVTILKDGTTGLNKIPGNVSSFQALLQLKSTSASRDVFSMEKNTGEKWSFWLSPSFNLYYNDAQKGFFSPVDGAYASVSDMRLKKDIKPFDPVLDGVLQLNPCTYHFKDNELGSPVSHGFIAQEVQKIFPDLVSISIDRNGQQILALNYSNFAVLAIKAIQEQQQIIDKQNKKIEEIEERLLAMETNFEKNK